MPPEVMFDIKSVDNGRVLYDQKKIMELNPQRHEMLQLTAVVHVDSTQHLVVGYKDITNDEFWVRGHMPGFPLMPGVIMCEAAAQLTGFLVKLDKLLDGKFIVFAGMDNVRFRGQVKPGDRFWLAGKAIKANRRQITSKTQGFVKDKMVFEGEIIGMPFTPLDSSES
jgi:3-hydroxyacyl-[acyl-carrier-protein] dehydratase